MRTPKVHYGVKVIVDIACGIDAIFYNKRRAKCHLTLSMMIFRPATFNKRKVTCKRCRKTKAFKSGRTKQEMYE